jgi:hypothetical protein
MGGTRLIEAWGKQTFLKRKGVDLRIGVVKVEAVTKTGGHDKGISRGQFHGMGILQMENLTTDYIADLVVIMVVRLMIQCSAFDPVDMKMLCLGIKMLQCYQFGHDDTSFPETLYHTFSKIASFWTKCNIKWTICIYEIFLVRYNKGRKE